MTEILLRFVHISDTHYAPTTYQCPPSRFDTRRGMTELIQRVNALPFDFDFVLHTGDVAYDPHPAIYDEIAPLMAQLKAPVLYVPGNHDHSGTLQTALMGREDIATPLYYETERNGVRLIFLDSNSYGEVQPPAGRVSEAQLAWLAERIDQPDNRPIVVAVHHPLIRTHTSQWYDVFMMTVNGDDVHAILRRAGTRLRGVFFGHVHQDMTFYRDGILYSSTVSSWTQFFTHPNQDMQTLNDLDSDPGFHLVTVSTEGTLVQPYRYRVD